MLLECTQFLKTQTTARLASNQSRLKGTRKQRARINNKHAATIDIFDSRCYPS